MSQRKNSISFLPYCWRIIVVVFMFGLIATCSESPQQASQKPTNTLEKSNGIVEKTDNLSARLLQNAKDALKEKKSDSYLEEADRYLSAIKEGDKEFKEAQDIKRSVETELDNPTRLLKQAKKLQIQDTRQAEEYLSSISKEAKEFPEAQKLLSQIREKQKSEAKERMVSARKEYAKKLEYMLLDKGKMDTTVTVSGPDLTVLRIKWILWSRVSVHEMTKDGKLLDMWKSMGFKKVIFDGGRFTGSWTFDLN